MAKITLEILNPTVTTLQVTTVISNEASCNPLGVVVVAVTVDDRRLECRFVPGNDRNHMMNLQVCHHICVLNRSPDFIHIYFYDLRVLGWQNMHLQICDIQVCFP